jgi:ribosomal protein L13
MDFTGTDLNKTLWANQESLIKDRKRYRVDATGKTLGRLAVDIAMKLQ